MDRNAAPMVYRFKGLALVVLNHSSYTPLKILRLTSYLLTLGIVILFVAQFEILNSGRRGLYSFNVIIAPGQENVVSKLTTQLAMDLGLTTFMIKLSASIRQKLPMLDF